MPQVVKFLIVGAAGFMVNLGIYAALVAVHAPYALSAAASYLVSNSGMFLGNRFWTFARRGPGLRREYLRYLTVGLLVLATNVALLVLLVETTPLGEIAAQAISLLAVTPVAFLANKRWTFGRGDAPS